MSILSKVFRRNGKAKAVVEDVDMEVKVDSDMVLDIIKNCSHICSINYEEVDYKFKMRTGLPKTVREERLTKAVNYLKERELVGWGGTKKDISFFKRIRVVAR